MLENLLGSISKERVLLYLTVRKEGYAREIAKYYQCDLSPIQNQLERLENGSILICKSVGRTRVFSMNRRYAFYTELQELFKKAVDFLPQDEHDKLLLVRKRPRRRGKPL